MPKRLTDTEARRIAQMLLSARQTITHFIRDGVDVLDHGEFFDEIEQVAAWLKGERADAPACLSDADA
jgi:hypothetical protein